MEGNMENFFMEMMKREKAEKLERFRHLNKYVKKGMIKMAEKKTFDLTQEGLDQLKAELDKQREEKQKKRQLQQIFKGF